MRLEKGLLFSAPMVRALLNTKPDVWPAEPIDPSHPFKWQTRRTITPEPHEFEEHTNWPQTYFDAGDGIRTGYKSYKCPHPVGSYVYAKETHWIDRREPKNLVIYEVPRADGLLEARYITRDDIEPCDADLNIEYLEKHQFWKRRPSIYLYKWAGRLWFEVVEVRVERVNQISGVDAEAEGVDLSSELYPRSDRPYKMVRHYQTLWDSINGRGSFKKGPWVWAYTLKRISHKDQK